MKTFDNVAKLKLATLTAGQFVETGGYYTKGGGGAAKYLIVAPQAADGYGDHVLANGNVAVLQKNDIFVSQWGAVGDGDPSNYTGTNDEAAIQAALDYAESLVLLSAPSATDPEFGNKGGASVYLENKTYLIDQIEIPDTVSLVGAGKNSTILLSAFNGQIVRNKLTAGRGFDKLGTRIANFSIKGDRTKTNQVGLDTLRYFDNLIENISIFTCGGRGLVLRQAITTTVRNITTSNNVGDGIIIDQGINSWDDTADNGLPANANTIEDCHSFANDGAGLHITGLANGNMISGGSYENNYLAAGVNAGYNILVDAQTFTANTIDNVWTEGPADAHIRLEAQTVSSSLQIYNWKNIANGPTGHVNRALIVRKGTCFVKDSFGQAQSYVNVSGSIRPFRLSVGTGDAVLRVTDASGSTITDGIFVEDEASADTGAAQQENLSRAISGVKFDSTFTSTDPSVLDDYSEGVWTPTITTNGADFTSVTYNSLTEGTYTKIGRLVTLTGTLRTDAVTKGAASGSVLVGGLPFTSSSVGTSSIATSSGWATNHPESGYFLNTASTMFLLYRAASNGPTANLSVSDVATGANSNLIRFTAQYETNL